MSLDRRVGRTRGALLAAVLLPVGLTLAGGSATAQTSASVTATLTVPTILYIEVTNPDITFPAPTLADFNGGSIEASQVGVISHRGNVRHGVDVRANAATMGGSGGLGGSNPVRADKPASDLQIQGGAVSSWTGLSASVDRALVANAPAGEYNGAVAVSYRMLLTYQDSPGTYTLGFTYTIVAQ